MKRRIAIVLALMLALSMVIAAPAMAKHKAKRKPKLQTWHVYRADLDQLNSSGVDGHAIVYERNGMITVHVYAEGLEPGQQHAQHIHGFPGTTTDAVCPPMSAAGQDGILTLEEGAPFYGPVLLPLDLADGSFPVPNQCNEIHYMRTFNNQCALRPFDLRTVVLHGLTVGGTYEPSLPIACGELERMGIVKVRNGEIIKQRLHSHAHHD